MYAYDLLYEGSFIHEDEGFDTLEEVAEDALEYIKSKVEEWEGDCDKEEFLIKVGGDYGDYDEADYNDLLAFLDQSKIPEGSDGNICSLFFISHFKI